MKVFCAALGTETNSFSPLPTGLQSFRDMFVNRAGEHPHTAPQLITAPLWIARQRAKFQGWDVVEGLCAYATPGGPVVGSVYEALRNELLVDLQCAMPVDAVLLGLHGAMVAEGYDDCEGDLLARVRSIVGPRVAIGAALDLHANLSQAMIDQATVLVAYKEYPHTDFLRRAEELADIVAGAVAGSYSPHIAMFDCRMAGTFATSHEPIKSFVCRLQRLERQPDVLSISFIHGFAFSDVADMGAKMLVVTNARPDLGASLAEELGREAFALRAAGRKPRYSIEEALQRLRQAPAGLTVWADYADNSGAGAPNDSTFVLQALLAAGVENVALGPIWDPMAVRIAAEAGTGARLRMRIGGKVGTVSGAPVDLDVRVGKIVPNMTQHYGESIVSLGDSVALHAGSLSIVVTALRMQGYDTTVFTRLGIALERCQLAVVKSGQHFEASFSKVARQIVYVNAPGTIADIKTRSYRHIRRPKWPLDEIDSI